MRGASHAFFRGKILLYIRKEGALLETLPGLCYNSAVKRGLLSGGLPVDKMGRRNDMSDFKVRPDWMPFCVPDISEKEVEAVSAAVRSGWWARGPRTSEFEQKFAEYVGAKYCVAVNSCTAALHLALLGKGIGPGDEVITTPLTFASTANTILHVGATPVFADIDPETGLIDPKEIEKKITPRTKAIAPVHYSGLAADLDAIGKLCDEHNLFLSEDAAHAVETRYNGELIGHHPRGAVSYSFYATKNLACGEGGAACRPCG